MSRSQKFFENETQQMRTRVIRVFAILGLLLVERTSFAQFEVLNNLFGARAAAKPMQPFRGFQALNDAVTAAENGDEAQSLTMLAAAFKDGGVVDPFESPEAPNISSSLLRLSRVWESKHVDPKKVTTALLNVVFPEKGPGGVKPYIGEWAVSENLMLANRPNSRVTVPESAGAELVRWSILSKETGELKKRLLVAIKNGQKNEDVKDERPESKKLDIPSISADATIARVITVQLAIAENDFDLANKTLSQLNVDISQTNGQMLEYLCHAVASALQESKTIEAGLVLFTTILDRVEETAPVQTIFRLNIPWLRVRAAAALAHAGKKARAKDVALAVHAKKYDSTRFGPAYASYLDYLTRQQAIATLLEVGALSEALELAPVRVPGSAAQYGRGDGSVNLASKFGRELRRLTPAARLELLRGWALPNNERETVRSIVDFVPSEVPARIGSGLLLDVYSTNYELVATSRELGKLDELIRELAAINSQNHSIRSLRTLAMVMRHGSANNLKPTSSTQSSASDTLVQLRSLLQTTTASVPDWSANEKPEPSMETYVIAVEAALHPEWREIAEQLLRQLIEHSQVTQSGGKRDHFRTALMEVVRLQAAGGQATPLLTGPANSQRADGATSALHLDWMKLRPKMWDVLGFETANERALGALSPTWVAYEGYISHVSSGNESDLCFAVPLAGTFEVTVDCRKSGWTEGKVGYGGVASNIYSFQNATFLYGKGGSGYAKTPTMPGMFKDVPWNRYTIRVDGNRAKYYSHEQLVFEDESDLSSPWLTLGGVAGFTPSYHNIRIRGTPTIPREVNLLSDARLRGWIASYFSESKPNSIPTPQYIQVKVNRNGQELRYVVQDDGTMEGTPYNYMVSVASDWTFADGELRSSRRSDFWGEVSPSWLYYQRPLRDGESVQYEFYYEPGRTSASPTFGEVIYSLEAEKETEEHANASIARRLSVDSGLTVKPIVAKSLREGWNSLKTSLQEGSLSIEVNGKPLVTEKVLATNSRRIGFYHDAARTDCRIRNAVLTGHWPTSFDDTVRAALEFPTSTEALPNTRFLLQPHAVPESVVSEDAFEVARQAVKLDAPERYKRLHRWVMPNESHDLLRMSGGFTPTHPVPAMLNENPIDTATVEPRLIADRRMVQAGGNFVCPAILLALTASELDRLAELKREVTDQNPASSLEMARSRNAMLGMISLLEDLPDAAAEQIRGCQSLLRQQREAPMHARWGDVALASLAIHHPSTRESAFELLDCILRTQLQMGQPGAPEFLRFARQLHGQCVYLMQGGAPEEFGLQPKTRQWRTVAQPCARSRGMGYPLASFDFISGELAERGGHEMDCAYFQSPLRGNYEARCQLSHFHFREIILMGAGIGNILAYNQQELMVTSFAGGLKTVPLREAITPRVDTWFDYKIVVKDGVYASFVNKQKVYEEVVGTEYDPWLAVLGKAGHSSRAVRDLVITGEPVIPEQIGLLTTPDLKGWQTDYFAVEPGEKPFKWDFLNGELTSPQSLEQYSPQRRLKIENIIRYHRPMIEDGEITYEFFYETDQKIFLPPNDQFRSLGSEAPKRTVRGQKLVHPALDRMVCLFEPDGVKIHWLTDGRWDHTGLMADNIDATDDGHVRRWPGRKPLPLKPAEWNEVKFATKGDRLTIELNGETVFSRDIEPTNLRHFGLFHFANESSVQVRNMQYRGDWPKVLPSVADQELAGGPQKLIVMNDADLPDQVSWDFTNSKFKREEFHFYWNSDAAKQMTPTVRGLRFVNPAGETKPQMAGLAPNLSITGDFIATMDYEGLKTFASEEQWGSGMGFKIKVEGSYENGIELRQATKSTTRLTQYMVARFEPNRPDYFTNEAYPEFKESGRLRLQRRGNILYSFVLDPTSNKAQLISQYPIGTRDITKIFVSAETGDKAGGVEFTLTKLSIRAAKILKSK